MKYFFVAIVCVAMVVGFVFMSNQKTSKQDEVLRIHIRANSNSEADQNIKYKIKDEVVKALVPVLAECQTKQDAQSAMSKNFALIEGIANKVLQESGFNYRCKCRLATEEFPTRQYDDVVFESGFYDALIVELGDAVGDNWWCVVYPPMCFLQTGDGQVKYRWKLMEIINSFKNKD